MDGAHLRPHGNRRHTAGFVPRSSPLAGPSVSSDGTRVPVEAPKRHYRPNRITSSPDLKALAAEQAQTESKLSTPKTPASQKRRSSNFLGLGIRTRRPSDSSRPHVPAKPAVPPAPSRAHTAPHTGRPRRPSVSRDPAENWLTATQAPKFSRLGLGGQGVVMPVPARSRSRTRSSESARPAKSTSAPSTPHSSVGYAAGRGRSQTAPPSSPEPAALGHAKAASAQANLMPSASGDMPESMPSLSRSASSMDSDSMLSGSEGASTTTMGSIGTLAVPPTLPPLRSAMSAPPSQTSFGAAAGKKNRFSRFAASLIWGSGKAKGEGANMQIPAVRIVGVDPEFVDPEFGGMGEYEGHAKAEHHEETATDGRGMWQKFKMSLPRRARTMSMTGR